MKESTITGHFTPESLSWARVGDAISEHLGDAETIRLAYRRGRQPGRFGKNAREWSVEQKDTAEQIASAVQAAAGELEAKLDECLFQVRILDKNKKELWGDIVSFSDEGYTNNEAEEAATVAAALSAVRKAVNMVKDTTGYMGDVAKSLGEVCEQLVGVVGTVSDAIKPIADRDIHIANLQYQAEREQHQAEQDARRAEQDMRFFGAVLSKAQESKKRNEKKKADEKNG